MTLHYTTSAREQRHESAASTPLYGARLLHMWFVGLGIGETTTMAPMVTVTGTPPPPDDDWADSPMGGYQYVR